MYLESCSCYYITGFINSAWCPVAFWPPNVGRYVLTLLQWTSHFSWVPYRQVSPFLLPLCSTVGIRLVPPNTILFTFWSWWWWPLNRMPFDVAWIGVLSVNSDVLIAGFFRWFRYIMVGAFRSSLRSQWGGNLFKQRGFLNCFVGGGYCGVSIIGRRCPLAHCCLDASQCLSSGTRGRGQGRYCG